MVTSVCWDLIPLWLSSVCTPDNHHDAASQSPLLLGPQADTSLHHSHWARAQTWRQHLRVSLWLGPFVELSLLCTRKQKRPIRGSPWGDLGSGKGAHTYLWLAKVASHSLSVFLGKLRGVERAKRWRVLLVYYKSYPGQTNLHCGNMLTPPCPTEGEYFHCSFF